jgi:Ca2+-transporting ATPase
LLLAERATANGYRPAALLSFSDPLREDVGPALTMATEAGIQTVVVTGDHPLTTARIAAAAGLPRGTAVTGDELAGWSDERLLAELPGLRTVARALP